MADVFVSYDRRDRELAERVVAALTEQGLTVWWDDRITPHETWDKTIEREVDSAKKVLVLWTKHSVESDWVRTEAGAAKEATPPKLIQARFSDCKVPLAFRLLQHVDLIGWTPKRRHAGWDRLVMWLKDGLDRPAVPAPGAGGPIPHEETDDPAEPLVEPDAPPRPDVPVVAEASVDVEETQTASEEPVVVPATLGLGDFSQAPASKETPPPYGGAPAGTGTPPYGGSTAGSGSTSPGKAGSIPVTMAPAADTAGGATTPTGQGSGGIDKRLLIGGAAALGLIVVVGLGMMVLPALFGGGGGFSEEERGTLGGYLDDYASRYAAGGEVQGDDELARLADDAGHVFGVELEAGANYTIVGACDTNCRDVDLYLVGPDGAEIGRDILTDDFPVVGVTGASGGRYEVRIGMPDCGAETCIGAARVYRMN